MSEYAAWLENTDIHTELDELFITLSEGVQVDDVLFLYGSGNRKTFRVKITSIKETGWTKHRHRVGFECEDTPALRQALTYEVMR